MRKRSVLLLLTVALTWGCAYLFRLPGVGRVTTLGYIEYWIYQRERQLNRRLTPEEREVVITEIKAALEARIKQYITARPTISEDDRWRLREAYIQVGKKKKEEIRVQLGEPEKITRDPAQMAEFARKYWSELKGLVEEAWVYPGDPYLWDHRYTLYFSNDNLVAIIEFYWEPFL